MNEYRTFCKFYIIRRSQYSIDFQKKRKESIKKGTKEQKRKKMKRKENPKHCSIRTVYA